MPTPTKTLAAVAGVLVLAACGAGPVIYNQNVTPRYSRAEFGYAAGRRDLATVIRGNPFAMEQESFEDAVIEVLRRYPPRPQPTNYTASPGPEAREGYRLVLAFNAASAVLPNALCRNPDTIVPTNGADVVRVQGAFCYFGGAMTSATGEAYEVPGVDDPRFDALMAQMVYALFPSRNPDDDDDDNEVIIPD